MIFPDKKKYIDDARFFNVIPIFKVVPADFETPLSIFLKTKAKFLLESIERGENVGRYSMIGMGKKYLMRLTGTAIEVVEKKGKSEVKTCLELASPLEEVRRYFREWRAPGYEELPPFYGGAIGFLGYEAIRYFEDIPVAEEGEGIPDGLLVIPEIILVYDSVKRSLYMIASTWPEEAPEQEYEKAVQKIEETSSLLSEPLVFKEKLAKSEKFPLQSSMER
ncbi:MAG: hypothetical protein QHH14_13680, partial [Clostridiales bacterium]|nr:hypothetical protein [Clostridiales bacterium]